MMKLSSILTYAWHIASGYRLRIVASAVAGSVRVGCGLLFIWLSKQLVDVAVGDTSGALLPYAALLIATVVVEIVCSVLQGQEETSSEAALKNHLRRDLFVGVMRSSWNGRERMHTGDVVNRLEEDVRITTESLCKTLPGIIVTGLQAVGALVFLCSLSPMLGGVIAALLPLCLLVAKVYTRRMRRLTDDIRTTDSRVQTLVQEHLQHRTLILGLQRTEWVADRLDRLQTGLYGTVMQRNRLTQFSRAMMLIGFSAGYLTTFLWGVTQLQHGAITFGVLTAFLQLVGKVQRPIAELSRQLPSLAHTMTSVARLAELSELPSENNLPNSCTQPLTGLRLADVSFGYSDGHRQIVKNFSHDFQPGTSTAIVGETGVGKSTLMRLMLGLLQPQSGTIHLYNKENEEQRLSASLRRQLVFVPQGNTLLSGTIRDNLLLGNPTATDGEMERALHTAVADFVAQLPLGMETPCGEGGAGLSEGQAQRIAIARGVLCPGRILLLDEFSSALDTATERMLMQRLAADVVGKTLIIITHRAEVAERCDNIIELSKSE